MDDIDIDELTVEELIMLLDRSLDPALPVPVLMKAGERLAELDPRVMPARPAPPWSGPSEPAQPTQLTQPHLTQPQFATAQLASTQPAPAPGPQPEPEPVS